MPAKLTLAHSKHGKLLHHMGYAKLFSSITESSLWSEPKEVRLLFVTMLARAAADGFVEASVPGLARVANLSLSETQGAIEVLESPDPHSKNEDNEGRRILKAPGGWMVLNYEAYRNRQSEEERKEYMRDYMRKYRSVNTPLTSVSKSKESPSASASVLSEEKESAERKRRCTQEEAEAYCESLNLPKSDGAAMFLHWEEKGWAKIKDWKLTLQKWKSFGYLPSQKHSPRNGATPSAPAKKGVNVW